jgi:hypothetical protein
MAGVQYAASIEIKAPVHIRILYGINKFTRIPRVLTTIAGKNHLADKVHASNRVKQASAQCPAIRSQVRGAA